MPMGSRKSRLLIVQRQKKVVTPVAYRRACSVSAGHVRTYGEVSGMTSTLLSFAARSAVLDLKGGGRKSFDGVKPSGARSDIVRE